MIRCAVSRVMWVGRATSAVVGLAIILASIFGVASTALGANGSPFILGKAANSASQVTGLVGNIADSTKPALSIYNAKGGPALELKVACTSLSNCSKGPPMRIDSSTRVANLNADRLDDREASSFADGVDGKATDADNLDNKDSADFVQLDPSATQSGSIDMDGTLGTSGLLRTGSGSGTSQAPTFPGLVVRRINSTTSLAGSVVARTNYLRLERDGTRGGLTMAWDSGTMFQAIACMGINDAGASVNSYREVGGTYAGATQVFTHAQNVVYATCSFGWPAMDDHVTQVTLQRQPGDNSWVGTVISTYNQ
jgi:hypothetical protein